MKNLISFLALLTSTSFFGQIKIGVDYSTETEYSKINLVFKNDSFFEIVHQPKKGGLAGLTKGKYQLDNNRLMLKYQKEFAKPDSIHFIKFERKKTSNEYLKLDFDINSNLLENGDYPYYGPDLIFKIENREIALFEAHQGIEFENSDSRFRIFLRDSIKLDTIIQKNFDYKISIAMKEKFEVEDIFIIEFADNSQIVLIKENGEKLVYITDPKQ